MDDIFDAISTAINKIEMGDAMKRRITNACIEAVEDRYREKRMIPGLKRTLAIAIVLALLAGAAVSGFALARHLFYFTDNDPHVDFSLLPNNSVDTDNNMSTDEEGKLIFTVNGFAGDAQRGYIEVSIMRSDGGVIAEAEEGRYISRCDFTGNRLEFEDGHIMELPGYIMLNDTNDCCYHLECIFMFNEINRKYLGKTAKLYLGEMTVTHSLDEYKDKPLDRYIGSYDESFAAFDEPVQIKLDIIDNTVSFDIDDFSILDGGMVFKYGQITATSVTLWCDWTLRGPVYELQPLMADAYLICGDEKIPLGSKTGGGTMPNEDYSLIQWLSATVIDPESVDAIYFDGRLIDVKNHITN